MELRKYILFFSYNIKNVDDYKAINIKKWLEIFVSLDILWNDLRIFNVHLLLSND